MTKLHFQFYPMVRFRHKSVATNTTEDVPSSRLTVGDEREGHRDEEPLQGVCLSRFSIFHRLIWELKLNLAESQRSKEQTNKHGLKIKIPIK